VSQVGAGNHFFLLSDRLRCVLLRTLLLRIEPLFEGVHGFLELLDLLP